MPIKSSGGSPRRRYPVPRIDPQWHEALAEAFSGSGLTSDSEPWLLFLERGESATAEVDSEGRSLWTPTRTAGLALSAPGNDSIAYRSEPLPEDARRLVRAGLVAGFPRHPEDGAPPASSGALLPEPDVVIRLLGTAVRQVARLRPGAAVRAIWSGFEQQVHIARVGTATVIDRRTTARVRLEVSTGPGHAGEAVAECVLDLDCHGAEEHVESLAREIASRSEQRADLARITSGEVPVVLGPGVSGVLVHEIVGHALEGDTLRDGLSWLEVGASVAPRELSVLDDPRRGRAAWSHDDEGQEARVTPLVRRGRVVGQLHDTRTARADRTRPTGHGRRGSYRDPVRPRMGCTFIAAGRHDPLEVLDGIEFGVHVRRMESAHTDTRTGRAVFRVTDADRIVSSRIERPLAPLLLVVEGRSALSSTDRIGTDLAFDTCIGTCVRDGQPLVASVGGPTIRIGLANVAPLNASR